MNYGIETMAYCVNLRTNQVDSTVIVKYSTYYLLYLIEMKENQISQYDGFMYHIIVWLSVVIQC